MLRVSSKVSDLILSPGSFPMVELSGNLISGQNIGMLPLTPEDTLRIAHELIDAQQQATESLQNLGYAIFPIVYRGNAVFGKHISSARQPRLSDARNTAGPFRLSLP